MLNVERFCSTIHISELSQRQSKQTTSKYSRVNHVDTDLFTRNWKVRMIDCPHYGSYYSKPFKSLLIANLLLG